MLAHQRTGSGERIVLADELHGVSIALVAHQRHIAGDIHAGGTVGHTGDALGNGCHAVVVFDMRDVILAEAVQPLQHHAGSFDADGAVSGLKNGLGQIFELFEGLHGGAMLHHVLHQVAQLGQAHAAGHTLAAGLSVAHLQECPGKVNGTDARRRRGNAALHVLIDAFHHGLSAAFSHKGKSAQNGLPSFLFVSNILYYVKCEVCTF